MARAFDPLTFEELCADYQRDLASAHRASAELRLWKDRATEARAEIVRRLIAQHPGVVSRPGVMGGAVCIAGTRMPTEAIWRNRAQPAFLREAWPELTEAQIAAALAFEAAVNAALRNARKERKTES